MRETEDLDRKYMRTPMPEQSADASVTPSASMTVVEHEASAEREQGRSPFQTTKPLRVNKELPKPPRTTVAIQDATEFKLDSPPKGIDYAKKSSNDLWRTMVSPPTAPVQPKQDKIKQASQLRSAQSSPSPATNLPRAPTPVKQSPPRSIRSLSPRVVSPPPSIRASSPLKSPAPARPTRSPSPLFLHGLDFLEDFPSPLLSAAPSPSPSPFGMRSPSTLVNNRARRDSLESFMSDMNEDMETTSRLRVTQQQFAQQIPSKAARKLGVSEEAVMVLTRSPSRSSNFSDHNTPLSPARLKKNPFGNLFSSPVKKGGKVKLDISLPLAGPVDPVVLYTPSEKPAAVSLHPMNQEKENDGPVGSLWLSPHSAGRPMSPAGTSRSRSPKMPASLRSRRERATTQQWI